MPVIKKGSTDVTRYVMLRDSTAGTPETGYTITSLDLQYTRNQSTPAAKVDATALAATNTAHTDNYAIQVDATSSPGLYRIDWPDAAFATGADKVILVVSGTGLDPAVEEIELVNYDPADAVRLGLTALPNAAADAAGGLPISDAGGLDLDTQILTNINTIKTKTDFLPSATAGSAGGVMIAGSNAATTFATLDVSGATTLTGNVALAAGLTITQSSSNTAGVVITGNGSGAGVQLNAGATGIGLHVKGGTTSGDGVEISTTSGHGIDIIALTNGMGIRCTSSGTGHALQLSAEGTGAALRLLTPLGANSAITADGTVTVSGATTFTGAITATNASNNLTLGTLTVATNAIAWNASWDAEVQSECNDAIVANNLDHLVLSAVDTDFATTVHLNSVIGHLADNGTSATFDRTTDSLEASRDNIGTAGAGLTAADDAVITLIGVAGAGLTEAGGDGDHLTAINLPNQTMDIVGNITGNLSGSVGSVTGNVGGNVTGSVGSISGVTFPSNFAALGINASGHVSRVTLTDTLTTYTGNTVQTGDAYGALTSAVPDSVPADGSRPTVQQAVRMILQALTEGGISGTSWTIKKEDGSTTLMTVTLDSSTTPTSKTRSG